MHHTNRLAVLVDVEGGHLVDKLFAAGGLRVPVTTTLREPVRDQECDVMLQPPSPVREPRPCRGVRQLSLVESRTVKASALVRFLVADDRERIRGEEVVVAEALEVDRLLGGDLAEQDRQLRQADTVLLRGLRLAREPVASLRVRIRA